EPILHQLEVSAADIESIVGIFVVRAGPTFKLFGEPDDDILDSELHKALDRVDELAAHHVGIEDLRLFQIPAGNAYVTYTGKSRLPCRLLKKTHRLRCAAIAC